MAKVSVSREADALYIQLAASIGDGEVERSENVDLQTRASEVVFDFAEDGRLLGIEIIGVEGLIDDTSQGGDEP